MGTSKKKTPAKRTKAAEPSAVAMDAAKAMLQPLFDLQPSMELLTKLNRNMEKLAGSLDALAQSLTPNATVPAPADPSARKVLLEGVPDATADATEVKA